MHSEELRIDPRIDSASIYRHSPDSECSCRTDISLLTQQVKLLVGEDEFARYDRLLLQSSLDLMADVVYCPRMSCCMAVMVEPDSTMGICPACRYAFCTLCKRSYHGLSHCIVTAGEIKDIYTWCSLNVACVWY